MSAFWEWRRARYTKKQMDVGALLPGFARALLGANLAITEESWSRVQEEWAPFPPEMRQVIDAKIETLEPTPADD